jgi:hypothetical protein
MRVTFRKCRRLTVAEVEELGPEEKGRKRGQVPASERPQGQEESTDFFKTSLSSPFFCVCSLFWSTGV